MTDTLLEQIKDRGDWLVDAVATATQNRMFLRGEPECDDVACQAIRMNGEHAMHQIANPLRQKLAELTQARARDAETIKAAEALAECVIPAIEYMSANDSEYDCFDDLQKLREALATFRAAQEKNDG